MSDEIRLKQIFQGARAGASLSADAFRLWIVIRSFEVRGNPCSAAQETLAGYLGWGERKLRSVLRELEDAGWVDVRRRRRDTALMRARLPASLTGTDVPVKGRETGDKSGGLTGDKTGTTGAEDGCSRVVQDESKTAGARAHQQAVAHSKGSDQAEHGDDRGHEETLQSEKGRLSDNTADFPDDAAKLARLHKAVGQYEADAAVEEVLFRLPHPEIAGRVDDPWTLAREIGECYAGGCRTPSHGDLHGHVALTYHRARRQDWLQEKRAEVRAAQACDEYCDDERVRCEDRRRQELRAQLAALTRLRDRMSLDGH